MCNNIKFIFLFTLDMRFLERNIFINLFFQLTLNYIKSPCIEPRMGPTS